MTLSNKTKQQLISEVKKLQRKLDTLQKKQPALRSSALPPLKDSRWESFFKNSVNTILVVDRKGIILDIK